MIVDAVSRVLSADGDAAALVKDSLTAPGKLMPKKNLANMFGLDDSLAYGIETALFGRFVTSDVIARTDSSVSVAHATSVHAAKPEFDFFTVVDDLAGDASGADHLGESELAAGLYYSYLCIDVPGLVANLTGCNPKAWKAQDLTGARHVIGLVLELAAIKSPGAKKGSTAPYARSDFVLLEAGNREPRQLANAYLKPPKAGDGDLMERSIKAMATHLRGHDHMYGVDTARSYASTYEGLAIPQAVDGLPLRDAIASAIDVAFELA